MTPEEHPLYVLAPKIILELKDNTWLTQSQDGSWRLWPEKPIYAALTYTRRDWVSTEKEISVVAETDPVPMTAKEMIFDVNSLKEELRRRMSK